LQSIQRIVDEKMAAAGFTALEYLGAGKRVSVVLDGGKNGQIPENTAYFLNESYFSYRPHSARNFTVVGGDRANVNQDAIVRFYAWAGNMTTSGRQYQAVLFS
ncbi:MAG: phage major capsid protein, partial [bacterium]